MFVYVFWFIYSNWNNTTFCASYKFTVYSVCANSRKVQNKNPIGVFSYFSFCSFNLYTVR